MKRQSSRPVSADSGVKLRALSPAPLEAERSLPESGLVIGRDPDQADLVLHSSRVSRRHCRIQADGHGWLAEDLESTNGVYVNGQRIAGKQSLRIGDVIGLGRAEPADFELVASDGGMRSLSLPPADSWTMGRALDCDIALPADPTVSLLHAELHRVGDDLSVIDPGSLNGVRIDGRRCARRRACPVEQDQWLELGNSRLAVLPLDDGGILVTLAGRVPGLRLEARGLGDERARIEQLSVAIEPGTLAAVASDDPRRATALLDILAGHRVPGRGVAMHDGQIVGRNGRQSAHRIGRVGPELPLDEGLTVWQHLDYSARLRLPKDMERSRRHTLLATTLAELGLGELRKVKVARLDAAHRLLVAIAAELVTRPSLLCLDAPLRQLDPAQEKVLFKHLRQLARTGTTVLLGAPGDRALEQVDTVIDLDASRSEAGPEQRDEGVIAGPDETSDRRERFRLNRIRTLLSRQGRLRLHDPGTLVLYLLLPILLALAATALAGPDVPIMQVMMVVAMATGVFTAAPEIGADRERLRHEIRAGVLPGEDLTARLGFLWLVGLGQMLVVGTGMAWLGGMGPGDTATLVATLALVTAAAAALGLMLGTIDPTRARLVMPLAAALVVLQWIVAMGLPPDQTVTGWLFGRTRDLLPAWWGMELFAAHQGGLEHEARRAIRAAAFLTGQVITWMVIARTLLGRRLRQPVR
jgi:pSer/pThr/pTyr-binding forkhead associated (FHA) protein/ABC-type transport system involved in cytochrome c biogenesis ATPase subunit